MSVGQDDAARLDASIDALLRERRPGEGVSEGGLAATAHQLHDALPRFHPSFSFEEHLAHRLSAARTGSPGPDSTHPTPLYPASSSPLDAAARVSDAGMSTRRRRGLVAGGAIASGVSIAIPIAGAALVMWRRSRSSGGWL